MNNLILKLRLVYLPFLILAVVFIAGYTFLNCVLIIQLELFALNEDVIQYWAPMALVCLPVYMFMAHRIKVLRLKTKKDNLPFLYFFVIGAAIVVPTIIAQMYLVTATGKLTQLQNINTINNQPLTKYYKLGSRYIDKDGVLIYRRAEVSGKNSEHLTYFIYAVCPIRVVAHKNGVKPSKQIAAFLGKSPMVIIDGTNQADYKELQGLKDDDIKDISVLKGEEGIAQYGRRATDGVIIIKTNTAKEKSISIAQKVPGPGWV